MPDIALRAEHGFAADLLRRLGEGALDLAVVHEAPARPGLAMRQVGVDELILVAHAPRDLVRWHPLYVYVDWGEAFRDFHARAYPVDEIRRHRGARRRRSCLTSWPAAARATFRGATSRRTSRPAACTRCHAPPPSAAPSTLPAARGPSARTGSRRRGTRSPHSWQAPRHAQRTADNCRPPRNALKLPHHRIVRRAKWPIRPREDNR